jgi:hypothetical protein
MKAFLRKTSLLLALSATAVFWPASAVAGEQERQQAIEIGQTGVELFEQGQFRIALERFRTADRISHSPVFALYEARCLEKLGRLVEAKQAFEVVAVEPLPADAPPAWRAASNDAARELGSLVARMPSVRLALTGATATSFQLDGAPLEAERANGELALDPGAHTIEARSTDGRVASARFELAAGERKRTIKLDFPATTAPAAALPAPAPSVSPTPAPRAKAGSASRPATDALGVTLLSAAGVGLIGGAVTGLMAADRLRDIRQNCVGDRCRRADEADGDAVETLALVSTIGFAVGGAALGAWSVRVILAPGDDQKSASVAPRFVQVAGVF